MINKFIIKYKEVSITTLSKINQYGSDFQVKVISALLTQKNFLVNVSDSIDTEYFDNTAHKWIIEKILKYYGQYHTYPTMEVLSIEVKKIENDILKIALTETLREAYNKTSSKDLDWVENEFTDFCKNQQMKKAIMTSVDLLSVGDFDGIRSIVNSALRTGEDKNLGHQYEKDIESRYREDDRSPIPFPWKPWNDLTQGGAGKGDLILIPGNPGGGKSWVVIAIGAYAAMLGYNVLHYTLELGEGYVGKRYDAVLTGIPVDKLPLHKTKVQETIDKLPGKLVIKGYSPKRASFSTIKSHKDKLELEEDFKADLIIIDYLDYVRTKSRKDRKEEIDDVYIDAKAFAIEEGVPLISPSQANRTGAKNDIIEGDNLAGSYDKLMIADMVFSLARKRKDKVKGTGRFHWMKNRYGPDGLTFLSRIDTTIGKIDINAQPLDEDDDELEGKPKSSNFDNFDEDEKEILKNKFFNRN